MEEMKRWKKLRSNKDNMWYMLSDEGDIYREMEVCVDTSGRLRSRKDTHRKLRTEIRKYKVNKRLDRQHGYYIVCVSLEGYDECKEKLLHMLVAENFVEKPYEGITLYPEFIDGDKKNYKASNLRWVRGKEKWYYSTAHKPPKGTGYYEYREKIYKIPNDHILYKRYMDYLDNRSRTSEIVLSFMRDEGLFCGLVQTGWNDKIKKKGEKYINEKVPYFMISDRNKKVLKHDLDKLGTAVCKPKNGYYPIASTSMVMKRWVEKLKERDGMDILDVPSIKEYITLIEEKKVIARMKGRYYKSFSMEGDNLYMMIGASCDFEVSDEFEEVKGKEHLFND